MTFPLTISNQSEYEAFIRPVVKVVIDELQAGPEYITYEQLAKEKKCSKQVIGRKVKAAGLWTTRVGMDKAIRTKDKNRIR